MSNPKELHENTKLDEKSYPVQVFHNVCLDAREKDCVLYLHWHEHYEIVRMREGHAVFHIDTVPYEMKAGDIMIIPGGCLHVGYALSDGCVRFDCVVVNPSLFNDFMHDPLHVRYVAPFLEGRLRFPAKPDQKPVEAREPREDFEQQKPHTQQEAPERQNKQTSQTQPSETQSSQTSPAPLALLDEIIEELSSRPPAYLLMAKTKLYALFIRWARIYLPSQLAEKPADTYFANRDRFKGLIRRIESRIGEKMTVEEAASLVGLNPFHFCKMFKRLTGRTFVDFVNLTRMNEAEKLLKQPTLTITEIAGAVGCSNPNYFTKLYKQYKGMTPSQSRAQEV